MASASDILDAIDRRLYQLEQVLTSGTGPGSNSFDQIFLKVPGNPPIVIDSQISPVTAVTVVPGSFFDNIFADVTWVPDVDNTAASFLVEYSRKTGPGAYELVNAIGGLHGNSVRLNGLLPNQAYGVRVYSQNRAGVYSTPLPSTGYQDFTTGVDASVPSAPTGLVLFATFNSLIARWNSNIEMDVAGGKGTYRIDVATDAAFTHIVKTNYEGGLVSYFADLAQTTQYWVRVAAIDNSGNQSGPSTAVSTTTVLINHIDLANGIVAAANIIGGTITANEIATGSLTTALFTANSINANILQANTADIAVLKTSSLTTQTITLAGGSLIAGSPPSTGVLLNAQGLRLYQGGVQVVTLDAASGSATFGGDINSSATITGSAINGGVITGGTITSSTFKTAASGRRMQIDGGSGVFDFLRWYDESNNLIGSMRSGTQALDIRTAANDLGNLAEVTLQAVDTLESRLTLGATRIDCGASFLTGAYVTGTPPFGLGAPGLITRDGNLITFEFSGGHAYVNIGNGGFVAQIDN